MSDDVDDNGTLLPDDQRTSRFAEIVRKSRLDELPQLFNVLAGDMSLVGPRPAGVFRSIAQDRLRHKVKPGLTGPAQLSHKNLLSRDEILELDHNYVRSHSFSEDCKLLVKTPYILIKNWSDPHYRKSAQASNDKNHMSYK